MLHPHPPLHRLLLSRIHVISGAFDFVRVAAVAVAHVGLDPLARLKEMP